MKQNLVVMGASSGIGRSLIQQALSAGWSVWGLSRQIEQLAAEFDDHQELHWLACEATDAASVKAAFSKIAALNTQVNLYAHCVGSIELGPFGRFSDEQLERVLAVNLKSAMYGLREFVNHSKGFDGNRAAVLVSTCATGIGVANHELIAAAKGGLEGLAKSLAASQAAEGLRVNVVAPGLTNTAIAAPFLKGEVMQAASAKQYPLNGINEPQHVADALFFLLSDHASRITGTVLNVDGGFRNIRPLVR